jgi:hypothetical protein
MINEEMVVVSNETTAALAERIENGTLDYDDVTDLILVAMREAGMHARPRKTIIKQLRKDYPTQQQLMNFVRKDLICYCAPVPPPLQAVTKH